MGGQRPGHPRAPVGWYGRLSFEILGQEKGTKGIQRERLPKGRRSR